MAPRTSTATLASGLTLSYAEQGDGSPTGGQPPLVLVPGPTDSWRSYEPTLVRLPASVRAIAVSQRGHGDSDKPATGYRVEDFAADLVPFLDAIGVDQAVLVGHSGSCPVVRRVAADRPDRVAGLVLEASPTTLREDAGLEQFVSSVVAGLRDPIDPDVARALVLDTSSEALDAALLDVLVGELLKVPARVWQQTFARLREYDDTAELSRISAPTLLIWGDADGLVGRPMQDLLTARLPDASLLVYPGVGHTPRWEDPARFAADVAAFVERLTRTRA
jgi:pimeloyl-ACP methyl ester carboxylesterase